MSWHGLPQLKCANTLPAICLDRQTLLCPARTCGLHALTELVDDGAQSEQRLVDCRALQPLEAHGWVKAMPGGVSCQPAATGSCLLKHAQQHMARSATTATCTLPTTHLLHALSLGARLGDALAACQVHQRQCGHTDGPKVLEAVGQVGSWGIRAEQQAQCARRQCRIQTAPSMNLMCCDPSGPSAPPGLRCSPSPPALQRPHLRVVGVGVPAARLHHHAEDGVRPAAVLVHLGLAKVAVPLATVQQLQHLEGTAVEHR